jgi:hypothetical protein
MVHAATKEELQPTFRITPVAFSGNYRRLGQLRQAVCAPRDTQQVEYFRRRRGQGIVERP